MAATSNCHSEGQCNITTVVHASYGLGSVVRHPTPRKMSHWTSNPLRSLGRSFLRHHCTSHNYTMFICLSIFVRRGHLCLGINILAWAINVHPQYVIILVAIIYMYFSLFRNACDVIVRTYIYVHLAQLRGFNSLILYCKRGQCMWGTTMPRGEKNTPGQTRRRSARN